jgi:hypothetical protein
MHAFHKLTFMCSCGERAERAEMNFVFTHLWASALDKRYPELEIRKEQQLIEKVLVDSRKKITYRSEVATPEKLAIHALNSDIVHLSMHAEGEGAEESRFALEYPYEPCTNKTGKMCWQSIDKVSELSKDFNPFLLFLATSQSECIGNVFVERGIKHVVAIKR